MSAISGVVNGISTKPVTTKFGTKPTYSINVDGEWFKCGFTKPKCNKGDEVSFEYTEGTYGKEVDMKSLTTGSAATTAPAVPKSAPDGAGRPAFGGKGVFPIPALDGQRAIVRQNALTNARELYAASKGGKVYEFNRDVAAEIVSVARYFEAYACGDLDLAAAVEKKSAPKKEEPAVEDVAF